MQIRELSLKELYEAYALVKRLREMSYDEFEDLVYEMRDSYKMIGIFEQDELVALSGVMVLVNLKYKRHLRVFEFTAEGSYKKELELYMEDFAKMAGCVGVVYDG